MNNTTKNKISNEIKIEEKELKASNGIIAIFTILIAKITFIILFSLSLIATNNFNSIQNHFLNFTQNNLMFSILAILSIIGFITTLIMWGGIKILKPQEAIVVTLFGEYKGTLRTPGIYFINPLSSLVNPAFNNAHLVNIDVKKNDINVNANSLSKRISLKQMTLNNNKQKINDRLGNPIEIGIAVIWKINDTAQAVFNVDNYMEFLSIQSDISLRNIVKMYPYDIATNIDTDDNEPDEYSLRGSSELVSKQIKEEIQNKVKNAGIEIIDAKITHLAYSQEIASVMLQRQQAAAIIDARKMIVDGAVSMVEMAIDKLNEGGKVELDEERKAAMVSNLLVVLCGNKDAQPIVNSGSLY